MKKLYDFYVNSSAPKRLSILMVFLYIVYTIIDWLFDGNTALTFKSNVRRVIEVIVFTIFIDYALVAKSFRKTNKKESENSTP